MFDVFPIPDPENYSFLKSLPLHQAVFTWLEGDFHLGEETALIIAIKKGLNSSISDSDLESLLIDVMDRDLSVEQVLEILRRSTEQDAAANP